MQTSLPLWVVIALAVFPLLGALITQLITAYANLRAKRMELCYARKARAYREFMKQAATFSRDPKNESKYEDYLNAHNAALILASTGVASVLTGRNGLSVVAQRLRIADGDNEVLRVQVRDWYDAMEAVTSAMRVDLQRP